MTAKLRHKWHKELIAWWVENDMPQYCELCGDTFGLSLAHSRKRRLIDTKELYFEVAALCQTHHHWVEYGSATEPGTHARMEKIIKEIIERR